MDSQQTIKVRSRLDDGCVETYITYQNGRKHGLYVKRYKNSKLAFRANYVNGYMDGECISFYPDGKVQYKTKYLAGKRHGHYRQWNKYGKLVHHLIYNNGNVIDIPFSIAKTLKSS